MWKFEIGANHVVTLVAKRLPVRPRSKAPHSRNPTGYHPIVAQQNTHPTEIRKKFTPLADGIIPLKSGV